MLSHKVLSRLLSSVSVIAVLGLPISELKAMENNNINNNSRDNPTNGNSNNVNTNNNKSKKRKEVSSSDSSSDVPDDLDHGTKRQKTSSDEEEKDARNNINNINKNNNINDNPKKRKNKSESSSKSKKVKTTETVHLTNRWEIPVLNSQQRKDLIEKAKSDEEAMDDVANRYQLGFLKLTYMDLENFLEIKDLREKILNSPGYADILFDFYTPKEYAHVLPNIIHKILETANAADWTDKNSREFCRLTYIKYAIKIRKKIESCSFYIDQNEWKLDKNLFWFKSWLWDGGKDKDAEGQYWYVQTRNHENGFIKKKLGPKDRTRVDGLLISSAESKYPHAQYDLSKRLTCTGKEHVDEVQHASDLSKKCYLKIFDDLIQKEDFLRLSEIYLDNDFIDKDEKKAIRFLIMGAEKNQDSAFKKLHEIAGQKNANALYALGELHSKDKEDFLNRGGKPRKEISHAYKYYSEAAEKGSVEAQYKIAQFNETGLNDEKGNVLVAKNIKKAVELYKDLAAKKSAEALYKMGQLCETGLAGEGGEVLVPKNVSDAFTLYYENAAKEGNLEAQYKMAQACETGLNDENNQIIVHKNLRKAFAIYRTLDGKKHTEAQYKMAQAFNAGVWDENGKCVVSQNPNLFYEYIMRAPKEGNPKAQYLAATAYETGDKGPIGKDDKKAFEMYQAAAKNGHIEAQYRLLSHPQTDAELKKFCRDKLLLNVDPTAKYLSGRIYEQGIGGIAKDMQQAVSFYYSAALKGNKDAYSHLQTLKEAECSPELMHKVGQLFEKGTQGEQPDLFLVAIWYYKAALKGNKESLDSLLVLANDKNNAWAQTYVGHIYWKGAGEIEKDLEKAESYFQKASEQDNANANLYLGMIFEGKKDGLEKAILLYATAAQKGQLSALACLRTLADFPRNNVKAQVCLGSLYSLGAPGIEKDMEEAYKYYQLAAPQDDAGYLGMAEILCEFKQDFKGAIALYEKVALEGTQEEFIKQAKKQLENIESKNHDPDAQFVLGKIEGGQKNQKYANAYLWFGKAADQNHPGAIHAVGRLFEMGETAISTSPDLKKAFDYYQQSADLNYVPAYLDLARFHKEGKCGDKNEKRAIAIYAVAMTQNSKEAIKLLTEMAQTNPDAAYKLALMYAKGFGDKKPNPNLSKEFYILAAKMDHAEAMYAFGVICETEKNIEEAKEWYGKASKQNYGPAQSKLANLLEGDESLNLHIEAARNGSKTSFEKLHEMADQKNSMALFAIADMSKNGTGVKQNLKQAAHFYFLAMQANHPEALSILQEMAKDNLDAQYFLGRAYEDQSEYKEALALFEKAAKGNNAPSQYNLGKWYEQGKHIQMNLKKAVEYYTAADKNGHLEAMYSLGILWSTGEESSANIKDTSLEFISGMSLPKDIKKAIINFRVAAAKGHQNSFNQLKTLAESDADAQYAMGKLYQFVGKYKSLELALKYYSLAAEQNHKGAQHKMAQAFNAGYGVVVEKNLEKSIKYCKQSADQNFAPAQNQLAYYYEVDEKKPHTDWLPLTEKAANQGSRSSQFCLLKMAQMGSPLVSTNKADMMKLCFLVGQPSQFLEYGDNPDLTKLNRQELIKVNLGDANEDLIADQSEYKTFTQMMASLKEDFVDFSSQHDSWVNQLKDPRFVEFKFKIPGLMEAYETLSAFDKMALDLLENLQKIKGGFLTTVFSPTKDFKDELLKSKDPFFSIDIVDYQPCLTIGKENMELLKTLQANFSSVCKKCDEADNALKVIHSQYAGWANTQLTILREESLEELKSNSANEQELLKTFNQKAIELQKEEKETFGEMTPQIKKDEEAYRKLGKLVNGGLGKLTGLFNRKFRDEEDHMFEKK